MILLRPAVELFRKLRERRKAKKHLRRLLRHNNGYTFAMNEYFSQAVSLLELEACVETSRTFNSYDSFDDGVEAAIRKLNSMEMPNVYQPDQ